VEICGTANKATVDTGATRSFISENLAIHLSTVTEKEELKLQIKLAGENNKDISEQIEAKVSFGKERHSKRLLFYW